MIRSSVFVTCCLRLAAESEEQMNIFAHDRNNDLIAQRVALL